MKLTLKEQERLLMFNVAEMSRRRWKRGIKLNYIEAMSSICDDDSGAGERRKKLHIRSDRHRFQNYYGEDVMEGTPALVPIIQLEVMLPDGNKLVSIQDPIRLETKGRGSPCIRADNNELLRRVS